jgi:hypothetical protein
MDAFILQRMDKLFDWLQEEKGFVLPVVMSYIFVASAIAFAGLIYNIVYVNPIFDTLPVNAAYGGFFLVVWTPHFVRGWFNLREWIADSDRFDDPEVRKKYQNKAIVERAFMPALRIFVVLFIGVLLFFAVLLLMIESKIPRTTMDIVYFTAYGILEYVKCMYPKAPTRRTQTKLVPISIRS